MSIETRLNRIERMVGKMPASDIDDKHADFIMAYYAAGCCHTTASMLTGMPADTIKLPNVRAASIEFAKRLVAAVNGKTRSVVVV